MHYHDIQSIIRSIDSGTLTPTRHLDFQATMAPSFPRTAIPTSTLKVNLQTRNSNRSTVNWTMIMWLMSKRWPMVVLLHLLKMLLCPLKLLVGLPIEYYG